MISTKKIGRKILIILIIILIIPLLFILFNRYEKEPPVVKVSLKSRFISAKKEFLVTTTDKKSGLRKIKISLQQNNKTSVLYDQDFPNTGFLREGKNHINVAKIILETKKLGLNEGNIHLIIEAWDYSLRNWNDGNKTLFTRDLVIDTIPPDIVAISKSHNINIGGAALVVYKLSEDCPTNGVIVGKKLYPGQNGYFQDKSIYLAFFALDYRLGKNTQIFLSATDIAGNSARGGFYYHIRNKKFKHDTIKISDSFLNRKMPEFNVKVTPIPGLKPIVQKFVSVNRNLRRENYKQIQTLVKSSEAELMWKGAFLRQPDASQRASFADSRTYIYNGKKIDHEVHLGIDLASVIQAPIPAGNAGKVVFTGKIGIYGNTVVLDHGFGLFSMYSHMSSFSVKEGLSVKRGTILGKTGATGMAGGDHLHFGMLIRDTFINPIEWWDATWIKNNITNKLKQQL